MVVVRVFAPLVLLLVANTASALELRDLWRRPDQQGMDLLEHDNPSEAAKAFDDARWKGVSHFRAGNFEEAARAFGESDEQLYNQATSAVRAGDYQTAIEQFEQVIAQNPDHADARHNLDIARQLAGQDPQEQPGQSGEQSESADQQESEEQGESQSQPAEQDGEGEQQESSGSQDQQQSGEQNGEQNQDDPAPGEEATDGDDQQAQEQEHSADEPDDGQQEADAQQQLAAAEDPLSEVDQATEQWLRRIPDDPSQLLRGKIQLKHRTDYRDVGDMVEPW